MVTLELILNLRTHGTQEIFHDILITFGGTYRYHCAVYCLMQIMQISKYITLKSTNSILFYINTNN